MKTPDQPTSNKKTPAALLAAGALLTRIASAFETETVQFASHGDTLTGTLFLPGNATENTPVPGVLITGAWTTVKEQMPSDYAKAFAERGYAALIFDFRGWGESEGSPRFLEHPGRKIEDINAAAAFLAEDKRVSQLGGLGICASAGYMVAAGIESPHLDSIALVAPWLHNAAIVDEVYGGTESVSNLIATSQEAEEADSSKLVPAAGEAEGSIMGDAAYYVDPSRGAIEAYDNQFNLASWEPWLTFDAIRLADELTKPLLMVHSESAAIPQGAKAFAKQGGETVETIWFEETTQFDFYDDPESVSKAADAVDQHFQSTFIGTPDEAALQSLVESIGLLADLGEFGSLLHAFAPEVLVDYTAAFGGEAELLSRELLMERWASLLPGFNRTRHALSDVHVQITGTEGTGSANFVADHWIQDAHWQISGRYRYEFRHDGENWQVSSLTMEPTREFGIRDVLQAASDAAAKSPHPYLQRKTNRETVRTFLESLEQKDMDAFASVWANEAVQEMPYAPGKLPERVVGKAALLEHYGNWPEISGKADFTSAVRIHSMADPARLFVEFRGTVEVIPTSRTYEQVYGGLFEFDERGRISLFREYFNPIPFQWAFGLESDA